jgi:AcrR family transcriptional regulator
MSATHRQDSARKAQKAATSQAILDAARREFEEEGFDAASLRAIARRAGVSAASIIHHFGDKRDLLHAALFDDLQRTLDAALTHSDADDTPLEHTLDTLTQAIFAYYDRRQGLSRALLKESLFAEGEWAGRFVGQTSEVHGFLVQVFRRAQQAGEVRTDADPALFGLAYLSFFYFGLIAWTQGAHGDPSAMVRNLVNQHLYGLRPPERVEQQS